MAGLTAQGLEIKRQREVLVDLKASAKPIFQDLVPPGDIVDTGSSSTLGRMTGLMSEPLADLWEALQDVYLAFDPNSATGLALDNLVEYGGLIRNPPSASTAILTIWGNEGTLIPPLTSQVRSENNGLYEITIALQLSRERCSGAKISLPQRLAVGEWYGFTITQQNTTITVATSAVPGGTNTEIITALASQLSIYPSILVVATDSNTITFETKDVLEYVSVGLINTVLQKLKSRTESRNLVTGIVEQEVGSINSIATPILGWDSVNNPFAAIVGRDRESDEELRIRFRDSKYRRGQNIADALYTSIVGIDGVISASVYENTTDFYDPDSELKPHSFKVVVLGGNAQDIASEIWANKPLGISAEGNTSVTIFDSQNMPKLISFDRPEDVNTFISIDLTVNQAVFPANGREEIKSALIKYFNENFGIGSSVILSRLYTPINTIAGHQIDSLRIGTSMASLSSSNIAISYKEIARLDSENIIINIS